MPAKAPIGVKKAPMLLPIMEAYIAWVYATPVREEEILWIQIWDISV